MLNLVVIVIMSVLRVVDIGLSGMLVVLRISDD